MKKIVLAIALLATAGTFTATTSHAQVSVSFNVGRQPLWGPTGYDYAGYYYMPDIDAYYSIQDQQFIYMDGGQWVYRTSLPYRYRNYDLYHGYKVVVNEDRPWMRNSYYSRQYRGYRGRHNQAFIRDSRDNRYWENPNHPYHNQWRGGNNGGVIRESDRGSRNYGNDRGYDRGHDNRNYNNGRGDDRRGGYNGGDRNNGGNTNGGGRGGNTNGNPVNTGNPGNGGNANPGGHRGGSIRDQRNPGNLGNTTERGGSMTERPNNSTPPPATNGGGNPNTGGNTGNGGGHGNGGGNGNGGGRGNGGNGGGDRNGGR